jgi:peptidoglycan/LPS O-acetylase OafA/YrhL
MSGLGYGAKLTFPSRKVAFLLSTGRLSSLLLAVVLNLPMVDKSFSIYGNSLWRPADRGEMPASSRSTFVLQLQSVRALAALVVAGCHSVNFPNHFEDTRWARVAMNVLYGPGAVFVFFIISGFVLALTLEKKPRTFGTYRHFIWKRITRLFPALIFSTCAYAVYQLCFYRFYAIGPNRPYEVGANPLSLEAFIKNALLLSHSLNGVTWSLQVEGMFALLVPIIYIVAGPSWKMNAVIFLVLLSLYYIFPFARYDLRWPNTAFWYLFICQAGYLLALYRRQVLKACSRISEPLLYMALAVAVAVCITTPHFGYHLDAYSLAAAVLVAIIISGRPTALIRFLDWKPLLWLGTVSYSFYLFHPLFLRSILSITWLIFAPRVIAEHRLLFSLMFFILSVVLTIPFAFLSYHFFEKPFTSAYRKVKEASSDPEKAFA